MATKKAKKRQIDISEAIYGTNGTLTDEEQERLEQKATTTSFMLMFPAVILAGIAAVSVQIFYIKILAIALALYQFIMLKKFVEDYYKRTA